MHMRLLTLAAGFAGLFSAAALPAQQPAEGSAAQEAAPQNPAPAITPATAANLAPPPLTPENSWVLDLTSGGRVTIQLRPDRAPNHVERIRTLTRQGFYNGLAFHRVIEGFMAQGGDPQGNGTGGSELPPLNIEINGLPHVRGAVAMARGQDRNSANSQFYIMFTPRTVMDDDYTVFGRVVSGMNHVDSIARGEPPLQPTRIVRASLGSDNLPPPTPEEIAAALQAGGPGAGAQAPPAARTGPAIPAPIAGPRRLDPVRAPERRGPRG